MIRELTEQDLPLCLEMGREFHARSKVPGSFVDAQWLLSWRTIIRTGTGGILGKFIDRKLVGVIGWLSSPDLNDGLPVWSEAFWYVFKEHAGHGLRLLLEMEKRAKYLGVSRISMVHLESINPEDTAKLYTRLNYQKTETVYLKEL